MVDGLVIAITIAALLAAAFSALMAVLDRPPQLGQLISLGVVEALLVVQLVVALSRIFTGDGPQDLATFVGYLLTVVLIPPLAALLGWFERTRWGSTIMAVGCLVVPVLVVRLQQVWHG